MIGAVEVGLIFGVLALAVFLTFRVLDFPDLTVDGSFTTGAATAAMGIASGWNPVLATLAGFVTGFLAGTVTGLLHTKGKINGLLAGILTMIALWTVNLRIMGTPNMSLLRADTIFTPLKTPLTIGGLEIPLLGSWGGIVIFAVVVILLGVAVVWFLNTNTGLSIRATGDNGNMVASLGVSTDFTKTLTLALSNGLVGVCGALFAQYQTFADIQMGVGLILVGLASVILGQALFGQRNLMIAVLAVIAGSVIYRLIIFAALELGLNNDDMKAITAGLVVIALILPRWRRPRGKAGRAPTTTTVANERAASGEGAAVGAGTDTLTPEISEPGLPPAADKEA